ncbi:MAG: chitobiase/beta-hexosaminidase C-terminal domain-containing protein, partial [Lachnospiraceae bacterium]|nr:chitobiase/beta-hexosaminidase C-terminal domain-containing protein [Lachnospiraceae bacterium]
MKKTGLNRRKIIAIAVAGVLICAALCALAFKLYYITGELSFDKSSGFYDAPFYLNIQGGGRIFYTLDGSEPGEDSRRYFFPVKISDASSNRNVYSMLNQISPHIMPEFAEVPG